MPMGTERAIWIPSLSRGTWPSDFSSKNPSWRFSSCRNTTEKELQDCLAPAPGVVSEFSENTGTVAFRNLPCRASCWWGASHGGVVGLSVHSFMPLCIRDALVFSPEVSSSVLQPNHVSKNVVLKWTVPCSPCLFPMGDWGTTVWHRRVYTPLRTWWLIGFPHHWHSGRFGSVVC
jgi:hypothetical protein